MDIARRCDFSPFSNDFYNCRGIEARRTNGVMRCIARAGVVRAPLSDGMLHIRAETEGDYPAIRDINTRAFERDDEARLVEAIRQSPAFVSELSLVALSERRLVGHILFSRVRIRTAEQAVAALALAPLAVRPEWQRQGVGTALVWRGLEECRRFGHQIVVVVGHARYYPRFGFSPARPEGIEAPFSVPDRSFLVRALVPGALRGVRGTVEYPAAFGVV